MSRFYEDTRKLEQANEQFYEDIRKLEQANFTPSVCLLLSSLLTTYFTALLYSDCTFIIETLKHVKL